MTRLPHDQDSVSSSQSMAAAGDDEPRTMSLMSGVAGGGASGHSDTGMTDDELFAIDGAKPAGRKISQNTAVILLVALIAGGSLYAMRLVQGDLSNTQSSEVEAKIETALAKLSQPGALGANDPLNSGNLHALFKDTDQIVAMFAADRAKNQVPVNYLKKNPFVLPQFKSETKHSVDQDALANARAFRNLQQAAAALKLQTIMISSTRKVAIVNGQFVQPGQKLGPFTVKSMDKLNVLLTAKGHTFTLSLKETP